MISYVPDLDADAEPFERIGRLAQVQNHLFGLLGRHLRCNPLAGQFRPKHYWPAVVHVHKPALGVGGDNHEAVVVCAGELPDAGAQRGLPRPWLDELGDQVAFIADPEGRAEVLAAMAMAAHRRGDVVDSQLADMLELAEAGREWALEHGGFGGDS